MAEVEFVIVLEYCNKKECNVHRCVCFISLSQGVVLLEFLEAPSAFLF
jgi:hypothetical protein